MAVVQEEEKLIPQERVQQPSVERATVLHFLEEAVEMTRLAPHARVRQRTVDGSMPQILKIHSRWSGWSYKNKCNGSTSNSKIALQEQFSERTYKQIVNIHVSQVDEQDVVLRVARNNREFDEPFSKIILFAFLFVFRFERACMCPPSGCNSRVSVTCCDIHGIAREARKNSCVNILLVHGVSFVIWCNIFSSVFGTLDKQ